MDETRTKQLASPDAPSARSENQAAHGRCRRCIGPSSTQVLGPCERPLVELARRRSRLSLTPNPATEGSRGEEAGTSASSTACLLRTSFDSKTCD